MAEDRETKRRRKHDPHGHGARCVLYGCSNTARDGFSIYTMPDSPVAVKQAWVHFINTTRADFKPSNYKKVRVCSGHFSLDQFDEGQLRMCQNGYRTNPPALKKHAVPSLKSPDRPPDFFSKPVHAVQQSLGFSWDTDSIQSTSQQIRESMEAKIAKEKEEAKARQVRKAERKARKLREADKAKELEVEVETALPLSSASSTITMSTLSMPLPVPLPMSDDDPADYPTSSPSSATPTPAPAFNTCFAGASRAPSTDTPVIPLPLLVPRPKRGSGTVTSWTEDGKPIKRRRRSIYQREKEFQNIAEAYKEAAPKENEQQDAVSVNTNDEVFQAGPQMGHRRVRVKVRMHSFGSQVTPKSFVRSQGTQTEMQRTMVLPNRHLLVNASAQTDASNAGPTWSTCKGEQVARKEDSFVSGL